jgi:hypothetical protein
MTYKNRLSGLKMAFTPERKRSKIFTYIWTVIENFRDQESQSSTGGASLNGDQMFVERRLRALVMGDTCTTVM